MKSILMCLIATLGVLYSANAYAVCPGASLSNGTVADADQVMNWLYCKASLEGALFTGDVGIGTTASAATLDVRGVISTSFTDNEAVGKLYNYERDGYLELYTGEAPPVSRIKLSALGDSYIAGNRGRLGIGATDPSTTLDVRGTIATSVSYTRPVGKLYNFANDGYLELYTGEVPPTSRVKLAAYGSSYIAGYGGRLGVGTTTPAQSLDVVGVIRQTGCTTAGSLSVNSSGDITCSSDARLKNILGAYTDGLVAVIQLKPQKFAYKPSRSDPKYYRESEFARVSPRITTTSSWLQRGNLPSQAWLIGDFGNGGRPT